MLGDNFLMSKYLKAIYCVIQPMYMTVLLLIINLKFWWCIGDFNKCKLKHLLNCLDHFQLPVDATFSDENTYFFI